ncbi:hypothetical protein V8F33_010182 [Rhypophila sp. PSN 637]
MAAPVQKTPGGNAAYTNFHNQFLHVSDPNERRRLALAEIYRAPFGCGLGFFTDSYDIFTASLLTTMLGIVYYPGVGEMPTTSDTTIRLATSAGTVIGQLGFGALADVVCRKRIIITSEFATTKWRGAMMGAVFAMQGIGQLCAAFVMLFVTLGFKESLLTSS